MVKTVEARAVISAVDKTGNVFDKLAQKFKGVEKNAEEPRKLRSDKKSVYLDGKWIWMDTTLDGTGHKENDYITERIY